MDVWKSSPVRTPFSNARWLRSDAALLSLLLLLATLPYLNTLASGFVYDDFPQLVDNPYVRSVGHVREIFATTVWSFQGAQGITNYYRPLMTHGYLVCYQIFGPLPFGFHLADVLLHAAVVCVLFELGRRLFRGPLAAYLRWASDDRAERAFARAAALDPFDSHARFGLAALYAARGRPADAVREYEAGLETDPGNADALAALRRLKPQAPSPPPPQR